MTYNYTTPNIPTWDVNGTLLNLDCCSNGNMCNQYLNSVFATHCRSLFPVGLTNVWIRNEEYSQQYVHLTLCSFMNMPVICDNLCVFMCMWQISRYISERNVLDNLGNYTMVYPNIRIKCNYNIHKTELSYNKTEYRTWRFSMSYHCIILHINA